MKFTSGQSNWIREQTVKCKRQHLIKSRKKIYHIKRELRARTPKKANFTLNFESKLPGKTQNTTKLCRTHWMIAELSEYFLCTEVPSTDFFVFARSSNVVVFVSISMFVVVVFLSLLSLSLCVLLLLSTQQQWNASVSSVRCSTIVAVSFAPSMFTFAPPLPIVATAPHCRVWKCTQLIEFLFTIRLTNCTNIHKYICTARHTHTHTRRNADTQTHADT